ncbi:sulfur carrier protein ThiS [Spirosoma rhododendri]|uniref:Sulfur carrier protein ThiS n=1 Tax=Spirosoma rhododendri TaxID=2728024 RepID=A0A7L5DQW8_9BACT|nr:sulfur carrier protein ThiS [Spirosoma rhododendri]QJD80002.1 sulfur carrier protein ThiS [Spirosoma rhododendri]
MLVHLNRQPVDCPTASTLQELLNSLGLSDRKGIAVARNDLVVPRPRWPQTPLQENDSITLIQATQGG